MTSLKKTQFIQDNLQLNSMNLVFTLHPNCIQLSTEQTNTTREGLLSFLSTDW